MMKEELWKIDSIFESKRPLSRSVLETSRHMKKIASLFLIVSTFAAQTTVKAQDAKDRFFMAFHSSTYLDFVSSPLSFERVWTGNIDVNGEKIFADVPVQTFNLNIFSFGIEPRYNIREFDDNSAFAISAPLSLGLGQSGPMNNKVLGISGIGSFQLPILAKLYIGSGSTYKSERDFGISFGGGLEYNKVGLLRMEEISNTTPDNKGWLLPVATLGVHFWRGYNPMEINIKYGAGRVKEYYHDQYGNELRDDQNRLTQGQAKAYSFRVSISYLLNY